VKKVAGRTITYYLYDRAGNLMAEMDGDGVIMNEYVYVDNEPLAMIFKPGQRKEATYYYLNDHLTSPAMMTNSSGDLAWHGDREPFGDTTLTLESVTNNFRFPGQYYDEETGLHYNWHRYYDPTTGRYLRTDPLGLGGGDINIYLYVQNNPVNLIDPWGLEVSICSQPAFGFLPVDHHWIKTDSIEAGMGGARGNAPGNQSGDWPGDPVIVTDHTGRSEEKGSSCEKVHNVDEKKVNDQLVPGRPIGRWTPSNQCQSFAASVLKNARYTPGASGSWLGGATGGW
jgi:RHS repeat-associated protein